MCNSACLDFGHRRLTAATIRGRRVLEVGSRNVDGSLREHVTSLGPSAYVGVDLVAGPGVDVVGDANRLVEAFGPSSFDLVLSTEMLEHVPDWRNVVRQMKAVLRPGGRLLLTTRAPGFRVHGYPYDYWRFTPEDLRAAFADFTVLAVETDPADPGTFIDAEKPPSHAETDLSAVDVYSVVARGRVSEVTTLHRVTYHATAGTAWFVSCLHPATLRRIIMKRLPRSRQP